jgi:hypothetical protein
MQYFERMEGKRLLCRTENFLDFHPPLKQFITVKLNQVCQPPLSSSRFF